MCDVAYKEGCGLDGDIAGACSPVCNMMEEEDEEDEERDEEDENGGEDLEIPGDCAVVL